MAYTLKSNSPVKTKFPIRTKLQKVERQEDGWYYIYADYNGKVLAQAVRASQLEPNPEFEPTKADPIIDPAYFDDDEEEYNKDFVCDPIKPDPDPADGKLCPQTQDSRDYADVDILDITKRML